MSYQKIKYAKGIGTREIQDRLNNLNGIEVSPIFISNTTNKIVPLIVHSWRNNWDELATFFKYPAEIHKVSAIMNTLKSSKE